MKIAMIGLGDIAQKAYLPVITQMADIELVLCTRDGALLEQLAKQYRIAEYCSDYRQLTKMGIDAVMIHAATSVHADIAGYFLKQGIPTFVDKPLADNAHDVETLYEIAHQHGQPLYVGFNRRHIPLFNQTIPELDTTNRVGKGFEALRSLRWEKHRLDLPGELRTFLFDDFIHPLDSVNLSRQADLQDVYLTYQMAGTQLARVDVQWQAGETLLHASMNRQFGVTTERVAASYQNRAVEFDSFCEGHLWQQGQQTKLALKDWTPMLTSKGFTPMLGDWVKVVERGQLASEIVERNIASHQLAEAIYQKIAKAL
ncbi:Gfo/Idh/MocA family protein [Vibrio vulnificus]|uniref:Gfo/Idh/MocA family protein n=1 Tax=Vibrio vulnificus TaxID=672 RepID=UPI001A30EACB|nr:gfo/Idh/MocA family oxidoreductase [Vibrio vulnificus]HAU8249860.1 gfo/Idh/MocA family oxidoreductase [Vibrio vulnificus]HDY7738798.1 Gfo/Idh/MocA family oxidoreductase [Vibrio vulnificus]HDY7740976.1 Gfo/Idh/MocA family oxidoreductase [Vibrio vulnificus]HDY7970809.1 Gfo/Idh/MocA family oxidoreductase [Vibrio vulnificus]